MTPGERDKDRLRRVFGAELPQESSDERDHDTRAEADDRDRDLRENVPPHHF